MMLDWSHIATLHEEVGDESFAEICELCLLELETALSGVSDAMPPDELAAKLHYIKGNALTLGLAALARIAAEGEQAAAAGVIGDVDPSTLRDLFDSSRTALAEGLGGGLCGTLGEGRGQMDPS